MMGDYDFGFEEFSKFIFKLAAWVLVLIILFYSFLYIYAYVHHEEKYSRLRHIVVTETKTDEVFIELTGYCYVEKDDSDVTIRCLKEYTFVSDVHYNNIVDLDASKTFRVQVYEDFGSNLNVRLQATEGGL